MAFLTRSFSHSLSPMGFLKVLVSQGIFKWSFCSHGLFNWSFSQGFYPMGFLNGLSLLGFINSLSHKVFPTWPFSHGILFGFSNKGFLNGLSYKGFLNGLSYKVFLTWSFSHRLFERYFCSHGILNCSFSQGLSLMVFLP